jgi:hypothetical protein
MGLLAARSKPPTHSFEGLFDADLLGSHKASNRDLNGQINVICADKLSQVHLGRRLSHADHALQVADSDGERASRQGFAAQVRVESSEFVLVELVQFGSDMLLRVHDVLAQEVLRDDLFISE